MATPRMPPEEKKRRGARLRAVRIARGFETQEALADAVGDVAQSQISYAEIGRRWMNADTADKVCAVLGVTHERLISDEAIEDLVASRPQSDDEPTLLDPKERVRRSWRYEDAPPDARDAWEEWDEQNARVNKAKLDEEFYDQLLRGFVLQAQAGGLPKRGLLPGATMAEPVDDPDAPKR